MENSYSEMGKKLAKESKNDEQESYRVSVRKEANAILEEVLAKVNSGFVGGKVQKCDLANYVFMRLKDLVDDDAIKALQADCFDDREALWKLSKNEHEIPAALRKAIREVYGFAESPRKKGGRPTSEISTPKNVDKLKLA